MTKAPTKALDALARELQDSIRREMIQAAKSALERDSGPDLFSEHSSTNSDALKTVRRERQLNPLETRCLDHIESHLPGLNGLNGAEIIEQSIESLAREHLDGIKAEILQHVAQKSLGDVTEARRRLGHISNSIDAKKLARDLARDELRVEPRARPKPIDIENEDLRSEVHGD